MSRSERAAAWAGLRLGAVLVVLLALLVWWALSDDTVRRADRRLRLTPANDASDVGALPLAGEEREAWSVPVGEELRFSVRVPGADPVLRLHHAYMQGHPELAVRVVRGDGRTEEVAVLQGSEDHWKQERVPLPARGGEQLEIELAPLDGRGRAGLGLMMIADVVLESAGRDVRPGERPLAVRHMVADLLASRALERVPAPAGATSARVDMAGPACLELRAGTPEIFALESVEADDRLEVVVRVHPQAAPEVLASTTLQVSVDGRRLGSTSLREAALPGPEGTPDHERLLVYDLAEFQGGPADVEFALEGGGNLFVGLREVLVTRPHLAPRRAPDSEKARRVVIVMVDGLRGDRLGALGYEHGHTPVLDELARAGTLWSSVMLPSSWSLPNVATLLTGRSPLVHGVGLASGRRLSPRLPTLAHWASWAGVSTAAFTSSTVLGEGTGLGAGFDRAVFSPVPAPVLAEQAVDWLHEVAPFDSFLVLHLADLYPPHEAERQDLEAVHGQPDPELVAKLRPMDPRPGVAEQLAGEVGPLYDAELARVDRALGTLVSGLRELGQWEQTLFVVLSTHGQEFYEHGGRGSAQSLYDEVVRVPAIAVGPEIEALREPVTQPVALDDLSVLIGWRARLASAEALPGREPPPYGPGGAERTWHALLMPHAGVTTRWLEASRRGGLLLLSDPLLDKRGVFDLERDPLARNDLLQNADDLVIRTEAEALAEHFETWYRDELTERAAWPVAR